MTILIDDQIFHNQKFGGISRYFSEVLKYLSEEKDIKVNHLILYTENIHFNETIKSYKSPLFEIERVLRLKFSKNKKLNFYHKKRQEYTKKQLQKQKFDVFVPTYYDSYFLDFIENKPFVLTVYDMIHEIFPNYFPEDQITSQNKKKLIEKASKIIAISESTKNDILKFYPSISPEKIKVVYLSQSIDLSKSVNLQLPDNYILFVGNRSSYKNFAFLLSSIADYLQQNPSLHLVCAGGNEFTTDEQKFISQYKLNNQIIQKNFKDFELASYYKNAICFVFPSEYEGFGIPVLESMVCGCPVVLARHSSFIEVAGNAGVYFNLNDKYDLLQKIKLLLEDKTYRLQMGEKGKYQASKFSWQKTVFDCLDVYKSVL